MVLLNNSFDITNTSYSFTKAETATSRIIKLFLFLLVQLPSVCCSLFLLFHLITKPALRRALHNHTIIALVVVSFFQTISDLPMVLEYLRTGQAPSSTFCLLWNFFALSNYAVGIWVMTWASLERHLLIFHDQLFATVRGKIFFHYIPLFTSMAIPWMYYVILVFFYPCTNTFYRSILFCGWCCYVYNDHIVFFNWLAFGVAPTCCITLLSLWLMIRIVLQKRRVRQRLSWRKYRRMIIQLLSIASLYIFFDAPTIIIGLIQLLALPTFAVNIQTLYLYYIVYLLPLLVPFVCLSSFPNLWTEVRDQVHLSVTITRPLRTRQDERANEITKIVQTQIVTLPMVVVADRDHRVIYV